MQEQYLQIEPRQVMQKHGKSFYFASQLFRREQMDNISLLYSMCRYIDDCADELAPEASKLALERLRLALQGKSDAHSMKECLNKLRSLGVREVYLEQLLSGAEFDAKGGKIRTKNELLIYCYKVAGVIGLMMNPLLGARSTQAKPFAVDLGIGMQLTNICRDVLEDAQNGRCYLPQEEVQAANLNLADLAKKGKTPPQLKSLVKEYLALADRYYFSSIKGLRFIPLRPRIAILVAVFVYRGIGIKLLQQDAEVLHGRIYLNFWEKLAVTLKALATIATPSFWRGAPHETSMHAALSGLPGIWEEV